MSDFYIYLPSNVDDNVLNEKNTQSKFKINLAESISLQGNWEVGLKEISIPNYWYNISPPDNLLVVEALPSIQRIDDAEEDKTKGDEGKALYLMDTHGYVHRRDNISLGLLSGRLSVEDSRRIGLTLDDITESQNIIIQPGKYSGETFVKAFNRELRNTPNSDRDLFQGIKAIYDEATKKITFQLGPGDKIHVPSRKLGQMMGFNEKKDKNTVSLAWNHVGKKRIELEKAAEFKLYGRHMFIYCSLVKYSQVGNVFAPILRVVNMDVRDESQENVHCEYWEAQYHQLRYNQFNSIDIEIYDAYGSMPEFARGNVLVVLHFRPRI